MTDPIRRWQDIDPKDAAGLDLSTDLAITAPLNELGQRCPWPWEPQMLIDAPLGQYRCRFCYAMVMAGMPHFDYAPEERQVTLETVNELLSWCQPSAVVHNPDSTGGEVRGLAVESDGQQTIALIGDWIIRDGFGDFTIRKG